MRGVLGIAKKVEEEEEERKAKVKEKAKEKTEMSKKEELGNYKGIKIEL